MLLLLLLSLLLIASPLERLSLVSDTISKIMRSFGRGCIVSAAVLPLLLLLFCYCCSAAVCCVAPSFEDGCTVQGPAKNR